MKNLLAVLLGLTLWPLPALADAPEALGRQARTLLQTHCASCHGGGKANKGGFGFVLDRDRLVSRLLVVPGQAGQSELLARIRQGEMPPPKQKQRPSPDEIKTLERWIDAGAPGFEPPVAAANVLSPRAATAAIIADLQQLAPRQRRFMRYLTLSHLAAAGRSETDLATVREAAGKLLNSLSWHPRVSVPVPIDAGATILRMDLRAYQWTASQWDKLASVYPYRFQSDAETRALQNATGSEVAALRADWFVATASRPPFYHDLLQLPTTDRALERQLQVDVPGNQHDDNILRAGFNDSGVSKNNRLLERHDAAFGALWRSYDFAANRGRQNLFEHPVGPNAGTTSFQPAGGEIIFHLPNGLQAYLLVDAKGRRINKAPSEIVADPRRPDQRVETGISCMSCHARGLLPKADQVRGHVEKHALLFGKDIVEAVRATHLRKEKFQRQIDDDNVRYVKALSAFGLREPDQEPINLITQRFEATLDGRTAAAELGLTTAELARFLQRHPDQARLFGSLLVPGGTVQRETFQENFAALAQRLLKDQADLARPAPDTAIQGHTGTINAIVFSSDGKRSASAGDDRSIRVWEVATGQPLACLEGHRNEVTAVAFSIDGKFLVSAGRDRLVKLWSLELLKEVRTFPGHTAPIRCVAFSADGKQAVSGSEDRSLRLWDLATGSEVATLAGHEDTITSVAWSRDGQRILSGSRDGTVRWWDAIQHKPLQCLTNHVGPVLSVALSPDGKTALSGGNDKTVRGWDLTNGKEWHCFHGHANAVVQVQFHPDGEEFFSGSSQHQNAEPIWRRWRLKPAREMGARAAGVEDRFGCVAFSPDGRTILVGGPAGFLKRWSW